MVHACCYCFTRIVYIIGQLAGNWYDDMMRISHHVIHGIYMLHAAADEAYQVDEPRRR